MTRKLVLAHMKVAGYHNDKATFNRLYVENRISRPVANAAYMDGIRERAAGIGCTCYECKRSALVNPH